MKSRPINLKPWEARAFALGNKTRITRVVKPQPPEGSALYVGNYFPMVVGRDGEQRPATREAYGAWSEDGEYACRSPLGQPGDEIWGRETFGWVRFVGIHDGDIHESTLVYRADEPSRRPLRWESPLAMSRDYCRTVRTIKSVRVERLQDISREDAIAEGIERNWMDDIGGLVGQEWSETEHGWSPYCGHECCECFPASDPQESFRGLWQSINGPGSWDENPWVWVVEFERKQS